jgi:hypothetical protein
MTQIETVERAQNVRAPRPSLLYLAFDVGFLNPSRALLRNVLRGATDAKFFGPGFQPRGILDRGIEAFVSANGPFDFVLADETAIEDFDDLERRGKLRFHNHACRFDRSLLGMGRDYQNYLKRCTDTRIIALLQSDYYNFPQQRIDTIEATGDYFLAWGEEFIKPRSEMRESVMIPGGINSQAFANSNDRYLHFLKRHPGRIISCPQFVSERELYRRPLSERTFDWSVLGADYDERVMARDALDHAGKKRSGDWIRYVFAAAQKLRVNLYNKYMTIALLQWAFQRALRQSRYSYTCGSFVRWPIRKYYEIPANGCVMVCDQPNGFRELGFVDGQNAVVSAGKDVLDADAWLRADPDRSQAIADAGRDLVERCHSVSARTRQIAMVLDRIRRKQFHGSRWRAGEFKLLGP